MDVVARKVNKAFQISIIDSKDLNSGGFSRFLIDYCKICNSKLEKMLKKLKFSKEIGAPKETVWKALWDGSNYGKWTSVFAPGSKAISDWKEGSTILFLDGKGNGMYSKIVELIPNRTVSFRHLGIVKNGNEMEETDDSKSWTGCEERYILKETDGKTKLDVTLDSTLEFKDYFQKTFPKALKVVKQISEEQNSK